MDVGLIIENWKRIFEFWTCVKDLTRIYRSGLVKDIWILDIGEEEDSDYSV